MRVVYVPLTVPVLMRVLCTLPFVLLGIAAGVYTGIGLGEVYGVHADLVFPWTPSLDNGTVTLDASVDLTGVRVVECVPLPDSQVHVGGLNRLCRSSSVIFNDCSGERDDPRFAPVPTSAPNASAAATNRSSVTAWVDTTRHIASRSRRLEELYCASPHTARAATGLALAAGVAGIASFGLSFFDDRTLGPTATFASACLVGSAGLIATLVDDVGTDRAVANFDVGGDLPSAFSHRGGYGEGFFLAVVGAGCFAIAAVAGWSAICAELPLLVEEESDLDDTDRDNGGGGGGHHRDATGDAASNVSNGAASESRRRRAVGAARRQQSSDLYAEDTDAVSDVVEMHTRTPTTARTDGHVSPAPHLQSPSRRPTDADTFSATGSVVLGAPAGHFDGDEFSSRTSPVEDEPYTTASERRPRQQTRGATTGDGGASHSHPGANAARSAAAGAVTTCASSSDDDDFSAADDDDELANLAGGGASGQGKPGRNGSGKVRRRGGRGRRRERPRVVSMRVDDPAEAPAFVSAESAQRFQQVTNEGGSRGQAASTSLRASPAAIAAGLRAHGGTEAYLTPLESPAVVSPADSPPPDSSS